MSLNNPAISPHKARDLVGGYFDAWNEYDASGVVSFFTRNGIYFDIPISEQHSGPQLLQYLCGNFESNEKSHYDLVGDVLIGADAVAFRYQAHDLEGGSTEPWSGVEFWTLDGDKVARVDDYYEPPIRPPLDKSPAGTLTKYRKSGLSSETANRYRNRLLTLVDEQQLYRQPDLCLSELAQRVPCSGNHLSQVINAEFGMTFFEFLNCRRVADASRMLTDDPDCYVLDVALKAGFNSSSAFYAAFKKAYDLTPTAFRREASQATANAVPIGPEGLPGDVE